MANKALRSPPSNLAASAKPDIVSKSFEEASSAFRGFYLAILYDLASNAKDFNSFKASIDGFMSTVDTMAAHEWDDANEMVRKGELDFEGLEKKGFATHQTGWDIFELDVTEEGPSKRRPRPEQNRLPEFAIPEAA